MYKSANPLSGKFLSTKLILASSSPYRKALLGRLHLDFDCYSPDIDETRLDNEAASDYVRRLAEQKALALGDRFTDAVIIGSDQCALLDDRILGKPGNYENALKQLKAAQGKTIVFHTGVCVLHAAKGFKQVDDIIYSVEFRHLSDQQLSHYLQVEQPYQCAGSIQSEGYGACLFSKMYGDDPTALVGLPLIRLIAMLESAGIAIV
ncbi:MAG: septum formation protein Maf [Proteobacteria bacterium]|nr:septum formation protein Maf [Pseudomonadota bacterium]